HSQKVWERTGIVAVQERPVSRCELLGGGAFLHVREERRCLSMTSAARVQSKRNVHGSGSNEDQRQRGLNPWAQTALGDAGKNIAAETERHPQGCVPWHHGMPGTEHSAPPRDTHTQQQSR